MEFCMNQDQVCPFEPKLCQNVATASWNPPGTPPDAPKPSKIMKIKKILMFPPSPYSPILALTGCCAVGNTAGAIYTS